MKPYLLLGLAICLLTGCANDYVATELGDQPANNLPLSRPDPIYSYGPDGSEGAPYYPPGYNYPANTRP